MGMTATTIAILGTGTMGEALLRGSLDGGLAAQDVWVTSRDQTRVDDLVATYGVHGTTDNVEAASKARIVVVAVPPQHVTDVVTEVAVRLTRGAVIVSLADGITLADLEGLLPEGVAAARIMPSLTSQVGHGLTLLTTGDGCTAEQVEDVTALLGRSGEVVPVAEDQHTVLSPLSSGGPAYFLYVADAMIEAGAMRGIPRNLARRIVTQVMAGSAAWLQKSTEDAAALRAKVTAPGGAGIKRIAELDQRAVRAAFVTALTRSV